MSPRSNRAYRSSSVLAFAAATVLVISSMAAHAAIPATERQALLNLYQATHGDGWTNRNGWKGAPGTECNWYGLTCNAARTHVTMINLVGNNLRGYLPPSLPYLTRLQSAYVGDNALAGSLPRLGLFRFLRNFDVGASSRSDTYLSGGIPPLPPSIETFNASGHRFTGSIPSLSALPKLREFLVVLNQLSGPIPPLPASIERFEAQNNQLTGAIPSLGEFGNLEEFVVAYNQLTGDLPALQQDGKLRSFNAYGNQLTGEIPTLAGSSLQSYDVSFNELSGQIPSLENVPGLSAFGVAGNQLTGEIPQVQGTPNLYFLDVSENQLTGPIPQLSGLRNLQTVSFSSNHLSGSIPSLAGLTRLVLFDASHNLLTGSIPALDGLSALDTFDVSFNQLTGAPPAPPSPNHLQFGHSALCPNGLEQASSPEWDDATGTSPWYLACTTPAARRASRDPTRHR